MKCTMHPMNDAIAICPSCGRNICEICRVNVMGVPHCKNCAEWILLQVVSATKALHTMPTPSGVPSRKYFVIGGVGSLIMLVGALFIGIFFFLSFNFYGFSGSGYYWMLLFGSGFFSGGLIVTGVGFLGFYKNYGSFMGLVTFVFSIIGAVIFISFTIFSVYDRYGYYVGPEYIAVAAIVGICLMLMGVTLLLINKFTMVKNLTSAAGILTVIVSGLFCSIFFALIFGIAWFMLLAACILMSLVFFFSKIPPRYAGTPHPQMPGFVQQPVFRGQVYNMEK